MPKTITLKQLSDGVLLYAEKELLSKMEGWQLWAASAALILLANRAEGSVQSFSKHPFAEALGIFQEDGSLDIDSAMLAMKEAAVKHGKINVDIPVLGEFAFTEQDVDALKRYIDQASA